MWWNSQTLYPCMYMYYSIRHAAFETTNVHLTFAVFNKTFLHLLYQAFSSFHQAKKFIISLNTWFFIAGCYHAFKCISWHGTFYLYFIFTTHRILYFACRLLIQIFTFNFFRHLIRLLNVLFQKCWCLNCCIKLFLSPCSVFVLENNFY